MSKTTIKPKVAVAMSGGVDSSVAAALLKKEGYDVTGFFMYFWHDEQSCQRENRCCSSESEQKVRAVAKKLAIPFYTLDFKDQFKQEVVDDFLKSYRDQKTPNPCVNCNRTIKFGGLLEKIRELGFDYLATGHYINNFQTNHKSQTPNFKLLKAKDSHKDQSYFLYNLGQDQLQHILFPLGEYTKDQIRRIAHQLDLPVANSQESQDVCFVGDSVEGFLTRHLSPELVGDIVDIKGNRLGQHDGLSAYTIGQRKGVKIGGDGPYYVVGRDFGKNVLTVTNDKNDPRLFSTEVIFDQASWVSSQRPSLPLAAQAVVRYNTEPAEAQIIFEEKGEYKIKLEVPQRAVMPGQSVVLYDGDQLLGGGVIKEVK